LAATKSYQPEIASGTWCTKHGECVVISFCPESSYEQASYAIHRHSKGLAFNHSPSPECGQSGGIAASQTS
jgi:hypothetical protein